MKTRPPIAALAVAFGTLALSAAARAQTPGADPNVAAPFGSPVMDRQVFSHVLLEQFEGRLRGGESNLNWDGEAWIGTDTDRLVLKSEGTLNGGGKIEDGRHELLYGRPLTSFFDLQAGVRYDGDAGPDRVWAAFGVEGLAPYRFHVSATAYASDQGRYAARLTGSYEQLLTQRLILTPQIEANLYAKDDPARRIGSGLSDIDAGLRLRYEITRKFAPYVGVTWERKFGTTADFARTDGERATDWRVAVGVRSWF
jgi:copper resistance protein B